MKNIDPIQELYTMKKGTLTIPKKIDKKDALIAARIIKANCDNTVMVIDMEPMLDKKMNHLHTPFIGAIPKKWFKLLEDKK